MREATAREGPVGELDAMAVLVEGVRGVVVGIEVLDAPGSAPLQRLGQPVGHAIGLRQPTAACSVGEGWTATLCGFMFPGMRT